MRLGLTTESWRSTFGCIQAAQKSGRARLRSASRGASYIDGAAGVDILQPKFICLKTAKIDSPQCMATAGVGHSSQTSYASKLQKKKIPRNAWLRLECGNTLAKLHLKTTKINWFINFPEATHSGTSPNPRGGLHPPLTLLFVFKSLAQATCSTVEIREITAVVIVAANLRFLQQHIVQQHIPSLL